MESYEMLYNVYYLYIHVRGAYNKLFLLPLDKLAIKLSVADYKWLRKTLLVEYAGNFCDRRSNMLQK